MKHANDYSNKQQFIYFIGVLFFILVGLILYINFRPKITRLDSVPDDITEMKQDLKHITVIIQQLAKNDSIQQTTIEHYPSAPLSIEDMSRVSSVYSFREDPKYGGREFHTGIDFRAPRGSIVHAAASGIVQKASWLGDYGNTIKIDHGNGYQTTYAHLSNMTVIPGEKVTKGDTIGNVGATGKTTGSHLHYEIAYLNKKINPAIFAQIIR